MAKKSHTGINVGMKAPKRTKHRAGARGSNYAGARRSVEDRERKADPRHVPLTVLKRNLRKLEATVAKREGR